ncbi:hypothetical protein Fleli_0911 [Bernardetia litoralis DSM 6794]|uniref:HEAT repeat protein n=1 Tax=Bernardetia litoralis (strain ATCC 23117 / DSM 6794 / NBRC 15988 / NCIMB 1366 / Fx l1 / Sio-4) TaxID=880071 RepID=I4AHD0_BERLS|nr:hypothetical protein [Bernardetia litoralis]AFM03365.1 hypothetical protein Fleli_0911 [Bernardetia litoralis DSM 6794]
MENRKQIENKIQKNVEEFWKWAFKSSSKEEILNGEIDSPSFPNWQKIENNLEEAFRNLNFDELGNKTLDNIIFIIAQQWDIGIILNWFNKGGEEIGQLGMTELQLQRICERGVTTNLIDAKSQLAASLYKIENKEKAKELLLSYYKDEDEYIRRMSLNSLHKLGYQNINDLLLNSWDKNEEYERMICLQIWSEINEKEFIKYCEIAEKDERKYLREFAIKIKKEQE